MTHKRYCVVYDMGHIIDGIEVDTLDEAICTMEDIYHGCMADAIGEMMVNGECKPTPEQIEAWDEMIDTYFCTTVKWSDDLGEYEDIYYGIDLDRDQLYGIGWCPWHELNN